MISNCCNNFGPGQFPEKLIPTLIFNIINNNPFQFMEKELIQENGFMLKIIAKGYLLFIKKVKVVKVTILER